MGISLRSCQVGSKYLILDHSLEKQWHSKSGSWFNAWKYPINQNVSKWAKHGPAEGRKVTVVVVTGPTKGGAQVTTNKERWWG